MTPKYTAVVWVGNFSGVGSANLSGAKSAGSLLFNIFKILPKDTESFKEIGIRKIKVDKLTEYRYRYNVPSKFMHTSIEAKPLHFSPFYKKVYMYNDEIVNSSNKNFYCAKPQIIVDYPPKLINYLAMQKVKSNIRIKNTGIIYPVQELKIKQARDFNGLQRVIVKIINPNHQNVFWYLNGKFIGSFYGVEQSLNFKKGKNRTTIISQDGEVAQTNFFVE